MKLVYLETQVVVTNPKLQTARVFHRQAAYNPKFFVMAWPVEGDMSSKEKPVKCCVMMATGPANVLESYEDVMKKMSPVIEAELVVTEAMDKAAETA